MTVYAISFKPQKVCTKMVTPCIDRFSSHSVNGLPCGRDKNRYRIFRKLRITPLFFIQSVQIWIVNVKTYFLTAL